ncbi:MAG: carbon-nitrogen hydrolase family protein [Firmicutes bacterium]|nr:carbon-nitrogen hydrolase family protein [Bacillota bacterium]
MEPTAVTLAAVQASPVFLNRHATLDKALRLIAEAARLGAKVIVFPEAFIPAFPYWYYFFPAHSTAAQALAQRLFEEAVEVPGPITARLGEAARNAQTWVVMGVNERRPGTLGTLYNSLVFIDPSGRLAGVHRKLVPTLSERLVHAPGDGSGLRTYPAAFGRLGGLICGEHFNSFARLALLLQEERIHAAAWPAFPLARQVGGRTIDVRIAYHAMEGRVFVVSAAGLLDDHAVDAMGLGPSERSLIASRGGHSGIVGPDGTYRAGPVDEEEAIITANVDLREVTAQKLLFDLTGHSNRPDLFTLEIRTPSAPPLRLTPGSLPPAEQEDCDSKS